MIRIALLVALLLASSTAVAAPSAGDREKAAASFKIGDAAYARGDFSGAAAAYEQAALYAPHPSTMLNAAESWELADKPARAAQLCDKVLATPSITEKHRQTAQKYLDRLEKKIGTVVVKAPDKARIDVDEKEEPAPKIRVMPGTHKVTVTIEGAPQTQSVTIGAGESKTLDFLTPPAPKQEETKPSPLVLAHEREKADASNGPPIASWACFGVGVVAAGVGTFFGVKTLQAKTNFDTNPTPAFRDDFNSARLSTDVAVGVSAAAFAVGLVLWFIAAPAPVKDGSKSASSSYRWGTW